MVKDGQPPYSRLGSDMVRWLAETALFFHGSGNSAAKIASHWLKENAAPFFMLKPERLETNGKVCVCGRESMTKAMHAARCPFRLLHVGVSG